MENLKRAWLGSGKTEERQSNQNEGRRGQHKIKKLVKDCGKIFSLFVMAAVIMYRYLLFVMAAVFLFAKLVLGTILINSSMSVGKFHSLMRARPMGLQKTKRETVLCMSIALFHVFVVAI